MKDNTKCKYYPTGVSRNGNDKQIDSDWRVNHSEASLYTTMQAEKDA